MRLIGTVVVAGLVVAFGAQTALLMKTRSRLADVEQRLANAGEGRAATGSDDDQVIEPRFERGPGRRVPPPQFVAAMEALGEATKSQPATASGDPLPLPPALSTPEAREQLKNYVAAVLQQQREEERDRARQQRDLAEKQARDRAAEKLGLGGREAQEFDQILAGMSQARQDLFQKMQAGQVPRADLGRELGALRDKTDNQLKQLLGDDRYGKLQEVQREVGLGGRGWGGGGWPRGAGTGQPAQAP